MQQTAKIRQEKAPLLWVASDRRDPEGDRPDPEACCAEAGSRKLSRGLSFMSRGGGRERRSPRKQN